MIAAAWVPDSPAEPSLPDILSATALAGLRNGKIGVWDLVRPLPQRPTTSRRIGTEVHRLIEERSLGLAPYPDETEFEEPSEVPDSGRVAEMLSEWEQRYGARTIARLPSGEPMIELPFSMLLDGRIVRGRIDAVYETGDGELEIVDFKTGSRAHVEGGEDDQLSIYARALDAMGLLPDGKKVKLTYAFLSGDAPLTRTWEPNNGS
jgi:DNA helicase II / ATP-dependent DNA helicase PcrA